MKKPFFVLALALLVPGCSLFYWGFDATTYECQYLHNYCAAQRRHVAMARCALAEVRRTRGKSCSSPDYARGFIYGYADYLQMGGTGAPPPVPPSRYWKDRYSTPEGQREMELWYAGYRDGVATACQSGWREYEIVPSPHSERSAVAGGATLPAADETGPTTAPEPSGPEQIPRPGPSNSLPASLTQSGTQLLPVESAALLAGPPEGPSRRSGEAVKRPVFREDGQ